MAPLQTQHTTLASEPWFDFSGGGGKGCDKPTVFTDYKGVRSMIVQDKRSDILDNDKSGRPFIEDNSRA